MTDILSSPKVGPSHLRRRAVVYIRQSSMTQVRRNQESRQRQYDLVERSGQLGWPAKAVETIDEDQGRNATGSAHRQGFKKRGYPLPSRRPKM